MMHHLLEVWYGWVEHGGYWGIALLMAMESSIIPVPSEIVIPPAAFLAAQGQLSFPGVILAGTAGSYLGSAASYWLSLWIGRPLILRYGRYFLLGEDKIARAEIWLQRYEAGGIFFARLLPVIRHLISIPAGLVRMNFTVFSAVTIAGAAIWCSFLAYLGDRLYHLQPDLIQKPEALEQLVKHQSLSIIAVIFIAAILYFVMLRLSTRKSEAA